MRIVLLHLFNIEDYFHFFLQETWYYDEIEMQEIEGYDEPDPDSDYDYEDTYAKKRKRRSAKNARSSAADSPMRKGVKVGSLSSPMFSCFKIIVKFQKSNQSFFHYYLIFQCQRVPVGN